MEKLYHCIRELCSQSSRNSRFFVRSRYQTKIQLHNKMHSSSSSSNTWILEEERLLTVQNKFEREPISSIVCCCLYINRENSLEKTTRESIDLQWIRSDQSTLSKDFLQSYIQQKQHFTPDSKYIFKNAMLFSVDLDSNEIHKFSKSENFSEYSEKFTQLFPIIQDIVIYPSICIFHSLTTLYFIFQEEILTDSSRLSSKSILTKSSRNPGEKKKVTIKLHPIAHKKTRKSQ